MAYDENDEKMLKDFLNQGEEIFRYGCRNIIQKDSKQAPGLDIHEMGGVRMGKDPKTSMLNKWNQLHECRNVFVYCRGEQMFLSARRPRDFSSWFRKSLTIFHHYMHKLRM